VAYTPVEVDRQKLTIMGVQFPDKVSLNRAASAIGSNMYEGFEPTPALLKLYREFSEGKIPPDDLTDQIRKIV
ncbi:MAG: antitoxin VbhA family protein, partial [Treponema sp.]|jgi:putative transcriptional regulator|nr:antitoxin VbhA family protein [Treponema sp.]